MTRLSESQTQVLLAVLLTLAVAVVVALLAAERRPARTGGAPTLWDRHTARLALWFGEDTGEPLSEPATRYLAFLRDRRSLKSLTSAALADLR